MRVIKYLLFDYLELEVLYGHKILFHLNISYFRQVITRLYFYENALKKKIWSQCTFQSSVELITYTLKSCVLVFLFNGKTFLVKRKT